MKIKKRGQKLSLFFCAKRNSVDWLDIADPEGNFADVLGIAAVGEDDARDLFGGAVGSRIVDVSERVALDGVEYKDKVEGARGALARVGFDFDDGVVLKIKEFSARCRVLIFENAAVVVQGLRGFEEGNLFVGEFDIV